MTDYTGLADDSLDHDPAIGAITAGRTERQRAIAGLIAQAVITNGADFGGGDVVAVHSDTIGYLTINALREHGLAITRKPQASPFKIIASANGCMNPPRTPSTAPRLAPTSVGAFLASLNGTHQSYMPGGLMASFISAMRSAAAWARSTMGKGSGLPHWQYPGRVSSGLCAGRGMGGIVLSQEADRR